MRSSTAALRLLALLTPTALARISGISVPSTLAPGATVSITLITEDYIQSVQDIAVAFGLSPTASANNQSLGLTLLGSKYLGPSNSNVLNNITESVKIPAGIASGSAVVTAALYSLYGAEYEPTLADFTADVVVGSS